MLRITARANSYRSDYRGAAAAAAAVVGHARSSGSDVGGRGATVGARRSLSKTRFRVFPNEKSHAPVLLGRHRKGTCFEVPSARLFSDIEFPEAANHPRALPPPPADRSSRLLPRARQPQLFAPVVRGRVHIV